MPGQFSITISTSLGSAGFKKKLVAACVEAWKVVAERLLQDAAVFVPILTGDLLRSGRVEVFPGVGKNGVPTVSVVFGSDFVDYAETQHEDPYNHPSLGFFGAAKYLERPLAINEPFYRLLFQSELRRQLGN